MLQVIIPDFGKVNRFFFFLSKIGFTALGIGNSYFSEHTKV